MKVEDAENKYDLSKWREGTSAGEPLAPDTFFNVKKRFGVTLRDGIGMSECMVYVHNMKGMDIKQGSCGRIGSGIVIQLMEVPDEEEEEKENNVTLKPVKQGEPGVLMAHKAVHEAAAVESPDPVRDKVVKAFIVLREGYEGNDELIKDLQNHVKKTAAPYKYPRKISFVKELPKTQSGKTKRKMLRRLEFKGTPYQL
jgi:acyl-coenzyme A synthetase/AMP-(fatty) acid ligase